MMRLSQFYFWAAFFAATVVAKPRLLSSLLSTNVVDNIESTKSIMIAFPNKSDHILSAIEAKKHVYHDARATELMNQLESWSKIIQRPLQKTLKSLKIDFKHLAITNEIFIPNVPTTVIDLLQKLFPQLLIRKPLFITLPKLAPVPAVRENVKKSVQWGVAKLQARESCYRGRGVIVASIDTGALATHEALRDNHKNNGYWFDATDEKNTIPSDDLGHGTHSLATAVGNTNGVGVAPDATWMACRSCQMHSCEEHFFKVCAQWMLCPHSKDGQCIGVPHVITNSWGGPGFDLMLGDVIDKWRVAGIIPCFAVGNNGPNCGTNAPPGSLSQVIGVGSSSLNDTVSYFSSRGHVSDVGRVKPDVIAPGESITSAWIEHNEAYIALDGTSMAAPHVAGAAALMLSKSPFLTFDQILDALTKGSQPAEDLTGQDCGDNGVRPNRAAGWGVVNAQASLALIPAVFLCSNDTMV